KYRPVARRLDGEIRITTHIETGVTPYRRFVVALLLQGHPSIEADNLNSGIASIQIEAQDITPKCVAADRLRSTEQSTHPVQNIGIGLQAPLDGILGIAYVVFKSHPRCLFYLPCHPIRSGCRQDTTDPEHHPRCRSVAGDTGHFRLHARDTGNGLREGHLSEPQRLMECIASGKFTLAPSLGAKKHGCARNRSTE